MAVVHAVAVHESIAIEEDVARHGARVERRKQVCPALLVLL